MSAGGHINVYPDASVRGGHLSKQVHEAPDLPGASRGAPAHETKPGVAGERGCGEDLGLQRLPPDTGRVLPYSRSVEPQARRKDGVRSL